MTAKLELDHERIAILGAGNLGVALMKGLIDGGARPENIVVRNKRPERTKALMERYGVSTAASNAAAVHGADLVLLAVKPQILPRVLDEIRPAERSALYVSVAAGVSTATLETALGDGARVIRAMPNTPALIGEGATALCGGAHASEADLELATAIFARIGLALVVDEPQIDAVTGLSGSGPAYIMLIVEAFADAGVKVGMSREIAMQLAVQTIKGSAVLLQKTGEHPGRLKDQVTSPGGTAIAGLHTLEAGGLRTTIMNAVEAATLRARELGRG
jgi:pyrroline-5-carboxylate reductase